MMDKQVMQQALDALLGYKPHSLTHAKEQGSAIIALREAIAQPEQTAEKCFCDANNLGAPGVSCGDCPTQDYNSAQPVQPTSDMVLVPRDPTPEMVDAGCPVGEYLDHFDMATAYSAMIAAAPDIAQPEQTTNFCSRCGKLVVASHDSHTCTPPVGHTN